MTFHPTNNIISVPIEITAPSHTYGLYGNELCLFDIHTQICYPGSDNVFLIIVPQPFLYGFQIIECVCSNSINVLHADAACQPGSWAES